MSVGRRGPAVCNSSNKTGGKGGMTNTPISLQDLRRSLYVKAKAESSWRFWGLYVHVCKTETLQEAYLMAKSNDGAPGIDGVTFATIEESGRESFLKQIQNELVDKTYHRLGSCTPILKLASTPPILHKSRMRRRARTDLSGGRSVMSVPTGSTIV